MDEHLLIATIAASASLAGAALAVAGVMIGAALNARFNRRLEAVKAGYAEAMEALRSERASAESLRSLKRTAFAEFLGAVNRVTASSSSPRDPNGPEVVTWMNALAALELIASPAAYKKIYAWSMVISDQLFNPKPGTPNTAWGEWRQSALDAMRADIGGGHHNIESANRGND